MYEIIYKPIPKSLSRNLIEIMQPLLLGNWLTDENSELLARITNYRWASENQRYDMDKQMEDGVNH
jgi:hypothetical protein